MTWSRDWHLPRVLPCDTPRPTLTLPAVPEAAQHSQERAIRPIMLTDRDRRTIAGALDFSIMLSMRYGGDTTRHRELQHLLLDGIPNPDPPERDLTRPQELAADRMASEYGRSAVRWQADGSVVITGLTDDVERARVCVERDGTERWRDA